jgi:hypothetical protein
MENKIVSNCEKHTKGWVRFRIVNPTKAVTCFSNIITSRSCVIGLLPEQVK